MIGNKAKSAKKDSLLDTELAKSDSVFAENKALKIILIVIGIIGVSLYMKVSDLEHSYRAVIHFPGSEEAAEIKGRSASDRYIMMAAEFFASTYFSATPATVDRQFSAIMTFVHPTRHGDLQTRLNDEADKLKRLKTVSTYGSVDWGRGFTQEYIREYKNVSHSYRVRFDIARSIFVGASGGHPEDIERRSMAMDYVIENGRFWLLDLRVESRSDSL